ncbi:hypothetical protein Glove_345g48 [Diversispora epigaea]|uniref:Thioredoxin domain-containing protein n=1 Tax=Diversispora epigaea TaxID=1348612 RepID=A0A397HKV0_9GLOM|nr:hypothetical protein Glove_345g48 [Diversispora epigaea]
MLTNQKLLIRPTFNFVRQLSVTAYFHNSSVIQTGKILEATDADFKKLVLESKEPVIVDFYADWCGPCKLLAPILERVVKDNKKVTLVKLNTDNNQELAEKYSITGLPTVCSFHKGKNFDRFIGVISEGRVREFVEQASALDDSNK